MHHNLRYYVRMDISPFSSLRVCVMAIFTFSSFVAIRSDSGGTGA